MSKRRRTSPGSGSFQRKRGEWLASKGSEAGSWFFVKAIGEREIVIANLDANHTEQDLTAAFERFGKIDRFEKKERKKKVVSRCFENERKDRAWFLR